MSGRWGAGALGALLALAVPAGARAAEGECVPTDPAAAQAAVEDARRAVLTLEFEATLAKLEEVRRSLPCLTGPVSSESLALLYFYQGVLKASGGDLEGGMDGLKDAASVDPLLLEEREHSSQIREMWAKARDEVTLRTTTLVMPNLPTTAIAYVDGKQADVRSQTVTVYPGVHLIQVIGDDGKLQGTLMRVRAGETTLMPAELLATLTPRGTVVLDLLPRRAHVTIRQGTYVAYDIPKAPRRMTLTDVKAGAYVVDVNKVGFYPYTQGKVAVEGKDQTMLEIQLQRKPSLSLNVRSGLFWISSESPDNDPMLSFELVGRAANGWGVHVEYFEHLQEDFTQGAELYPLPYTVNPEHELEEDGDFVNGPPAFPNVTTVGLPVGARIYLGTTKNFRVEGADIAVGPKLAMDVFRGSAFMEFSAAYEPIPWVGVHARAGIGAMVNVSEYIYDKMEDDPLSEYIRVGAIGMVSAGVKVGF